MDEEAALLRAIAASPEDATARLVYADWLQERGWPGADYLRAEAALAASPGDSPQLRRELLRTIPTLPAAWRNRFEQPDLLLAPPVPFRTGWWRANDPSPGSYRSCPNLDPQHLAPDLPWLSAEGVEPRLDQVSYERVERQALEDVRQTAAWMKLTLPPGFEAFARDFPRRNAVSAGDTYFEFLLHDATIRDFPKVGGGHLVSFFGDMNYGNPHQCVWSLYLVPEVEWHCVVVYEFSDEDPEQLPADAEVVYCAPSFQAFLARWRLENPPGGD